MDTGSDITHSRAGLPPVACARPAASRGCLDATSHLDACPVAYAYMDASFHLDACATAHAYAHGFSYKYPCADPHNDTTTDAVQSISYCYALAYPYTYITANGHSHPHSRPNSPA